MNILQRCAEILIECGYAKSIHCDEEWFVDNWEADPFYMAEGVTSVELINECQARRQADAIEDWLENLIEKDWAEDRGLQCIWHESEVVQKIDTEHQWRLDRIKWCLEQLAKEQADKP